MAAIEQHIAFVNMSEEQTRQWVEAHPGEINNRDWCGSTPLHPAVYPLDSLELVRWLVHEKGADVNIPDGHGFTCLHNAESLEVLEFLLDCGAGPAVRNDDGTTPLMWQLSEGHYRLASRLLEDPRSSHCQRAR